jgi:hypothetical protein
MSYRCRPRLAAPSRAKEFAMQDKDKPQGQTITEQGERQQPQPRMPHERDESSDSQASQSADIRGMGKAAHDSVQRGQVDTDKGPVLDAAYDKLGGSEENKKKLP